MIVHVYNEALDGTHEFDLDSSVIEAPTWAAVLEEFKARWWFETTGQRFILVSSNGARVVTALKDDVRLELGS